MRPVRRLRCSNPSSVISVIISDLRTCKIDLHDAIKPKAQLLQPFRSNAFPADASTQPLNFRNRPVLLVGRPRNRPHNHSKQKHDAKSDLPTLA